MAARAFGSGTISFGLVSIPFKQYTAASSQSVQFNMLHKKTGNRINQQWIDAVTGEVVERSETEKGFEYAKGQYVRFTEEELKKLEAERSDRLDIVEFVPADTVDFLYIEKTTYLGPDKGGDRAYRLLGESMERMKRIAVGRYWSRGKEQLVLVRPYRGGLVMHQVFYADEVRSFDDVDRPGTFEFKPIEEELADKLIEQLSTAKFSPEQYRDEYRERVVAAVEQKVAGQEVTVATAEPQAQIIDLFEALKRSLKADAGAEGAGEASGGAPSERPEPGGEPKMPIKKVAPRKTSREKKATG
jgi:DNA end-binding protein Ku